MTQKRTFEYRSDDSTADFNKWMLSFFEPGVLHGFYPEFSGLNLLLRHDQKQVHKEVDSESVLSSGIGVILTKQGLIIKEDAQISLAIDTNEFSANPRIDLVVLDHTYSLIEGGTTAVYMVIKGTPSELPEKPALLNENTQIVVGSLHIPAGATSLNEAFFDREVSAMRAYLYELVPDVDYTLGSVTQSDLKIMLVNGTLRISGEITALTSGVPLLTLKKTVRNCKFIVISETAGVFAPEVISLDSNVMTMAIGAVGKKIQFNNEIVL